MTKFHKIRRCFSHVNDFCKMTVHRPFNSLPYFKNAYI